MSMLNSQGSLICLQRGYGFSFTPKQPFRSKTWCDPFEFILFRAHFWLWCRYFPIAPQDSGTADMMIFMDCRWPHPWLWDQRCTTSGIFRHHMVQQISLLHLIQVQDFTHHFTHGVPRSEPVLTSLQEVRQAIKDGEMCACDFASSQEECGRDAELYLDTKHWQREG